MKIAKRLDKLSEELRELPRHRWDDYLREFCEQLLMQAPRAEASMIQVWVEDERRVIARRPNGRP